MVTASVLLAREGNIMIAKVLPPPRGRPVKGAGKRKKGWYERGPAAKRPHTYTCALYQKEGHTRADCPYGKLFDNKQS